ncbi:MAG: lytic transglycosylase domain-containing protein [Rhodospirillaceae bacterium]|nr:lytic transglycosylase domain-containing protein [Rhodospirillaceae bacterium]
MPDHKPQRAPQLVEIATAAPNDETLIIAPMLAAAALPIPGLKPSIPEGALFSVLNAHDVAAYERIFAVQQDADWATADRLIDDLNDPVLMGHVLFQRYMHPIGWRSSFSELSAWLAVYPDHPGADRIYRLALRRQPDGVAAPQAPQAGRLDYIADVDIALQRSSELVDETLWSHLSSGERGTLRDFVAQIRRHIWNGNNGSARALLDNANFAALADSLTHDRMAAEVARGYFIGGDDATAREVADPALERSGSQATLSGWIAGLAAYREGDLDAARHAFEVLAAGEPDEDLVAAGAYWAARINLLNGQPEKVRRYLSIAMTRPYSFYGLLAQHALGNEIILEDKLPVLSDLERSTLAVLPEVRRAIALSQVGQQHRADMEFDGLSAYDRPGLSVAMLRLAGDLGLPATEYRLSRQLLGGYSERFDSALYPLPPWQPEDGFNIDPALLFAIMRRESEFRALSESEAGAQGPMQIMPSTAAWISGDNAYTGAKRHLLSDPVVALDLGQTYVEYLLELDSVDGNIFFALAAYNGGPGNLARWIKNTGATFDPLLFIETIPSRETRFFIESVTASYWIYRLRLDQTTPTLEMVAAGRWPLYPEGESILAGN